MAAPTVAGTTSQAKTTASQTSLTFAHTATGDALYVAIGLYNSPARFAVTVTYGGVALALISREVPVSTVQAIEWWYLATPAVGTANIVITPNAAAYMAAAARNVAGGNRNGVTVVSATAAITGTTPSVAISSAVDSLVLDLVASDGSSQVFTVGPGQTVDAAINSSANVDVKMAASHEDGAASVTMSWTLSVGDIWAISALSIPAAAVVPPVDPGGSSYAAVLLPGSDRPHNLWQTITPHDTLDSPFASLWVGGAGTVAAVMQSGVVETLTVPAGSLVPIMGRRVNTTGTSATNILALGSV